MKHKKEKKNKKEKKLRKEKRKEKKRLKESLQQIIHPKQEIVTSENGGSSDSDSDSDVTLPLDVQTPPVESQNYFVARMPTRYVPPKNFEAMDFDGIESEDTVYWEDVMSGKEELWLGEIPQNFDIHRLSGQTAIPGQEVEFKSEKEDWVTVTEEWSEADRKTRGMCVLLPSRDNQCFMPVQEIHGLIRPLLATKSKAAALPVVTKGAVPVPKGLKLRFEPFASLMPRISCGYPEVRKFQKENLLSPSAIVIDDEGNSQPRNTSHWQ